MSRDFDGTDDNISFGSDASIDDQQPRTHACWVIFDGIAADRLIIGKIDSAGDVGHTFYFRVANGLYAYGVFTTGATGLWEAATTAGAAGVLVHLVASKATALGTAPTIYVNGITQTINTIQAPTGTEDSDAALSLLIGETSDGTRDLDGAVQNVCVEAGIWNAAQRNQHRWYGRIGGGSLIEQPMWTDGLTNKGSATADGTATGTTMIQRIPRCERAWSGMMGCGR